MKVTEAILGLMDLVLLMPFFCSLHGVGRNVDWTLCTGREGRHGRIRIAVYKKQSVCS